MGNPTVGEIPDHWEFTTLGDVCDRGGGNIQTGPFGSQLHASDYVEEGIPSIMPVNIGDNRLVETDIKRITEEDAQRLSKHLVVPGDIIYSRRGDVERRALVREEQRGWFCGTGCIKVRLGEGVVDPAFASFYLDHPNVREWIVQHAVGATMPNLNTGIMKAIPFVLPPPEEQRAIASILGALDDKIELNRRMNATLESLARAIFKSWFVDFDPVRINTEKGNAGQMPASSQALATHDPKVLDLFPSTFQDSELGPIPEDWEVKSTSDIFEVKDGTHASPKRTEAGFPLVTSKHIIGDRVDIENAYLISEEDFEEVNRRSKVDRLDTLITMIGTVGESLLVHIREPDFAIKNIGLFKTSQTPELAYFFFLYISSPKMRQFLASRIGGTTQSYLTLKTLRSIPVLLPSESVIDEFNHVCIAIFDQIACNTRETATLSAKRDALLPQLLSGDIPVPEALTATEEVMA